MGMDKMLVSMMVVSPLQMTVLRFSGRLISLHPTARMIIQVAKAQEAECYDGTTSSVIFAELMKQTEQLLAKGIHPTMIVRGFSSGKESTCTPRYHHREHRKGT